MQEPLFDLEIGPNAWRNMVPPYLGCMHTHTHTHTHKFEEKFEVSERWKSWFDGVVSFPTLWYNDLHIHKIWRMCNFVTSIFAILPYFNLKMHIFAPLPLYVGKVTIFPHCICDSFNLKISLPFPMKYKCLSCSTLSC